MKTKKRFLSILLSLALVLGLVPGMSLTAYAEGDPTPLYTFTTQSNTCDLENNNNIDGSIRTNIQNKKGQIIKIEAITETDIILENDEAKGANWAQIQWGYWDSELSQWSASSGGIDASAGIHKSVVEGSALERTYTAQVQHDGNGKLWWVKVYFNDDTSVEAGDSNYPEFTVPTVLTATVGQTLANVTLPTVTNGTWAWVDNTTSVGEVGVKTFNATFTPSNSNLQTVTNIAVPVTVNAPSYTVTFNANGGTGTMAPQTISGPTELNPNAFTREGYIFTGWNTKADGTGDSYNDGFFFIGDKLTSDTTFYAQWIEPNVKVGAVFKAGDEMKFGDTDVILKSDGTTLYKNGDRYVYKIASIENQIVRVGLFYKNSDIWYSGSLGISFTTAVEGADCLKITSGSGTESDPYILELGIAKVAATVTTAPTAKALTYNGSAQELVTAGTASGGTMHYALGSETEATELYTTSIPTATAVGTYYVWYEVVGDENHVDTKAECLEVTIKELQKEEPEAEEPKSEEPEAEEPKPVVSKGTISSDGIYVLRDYPAIVAGLVHEKSNSEDDVEFRWLVCEENNPTMWIEISPWTKNNEWLNWTPEEAGNYVIVCQARVIGNEDDSLIAKPVGVIYRKNIIKDICQIPYGDGRYLMGIESIENPEKTYTYDISIIDCSLLAAGKDAIVYTTGRVNANAGNSLWTLWEPEYGYYWTLFRIYDEDGKLLDQTCYGFANVY